MFNFFKTWWYEKADKDEEQRILSEIAEKWGFGANAPETLTWLNFLAKTSQGALLAKILSYLNLHELLVLSQLSPTLRDVTIKYKLRERFFMSTAYIIKTAEHDTIGNFDKKWFWQRAKDTLSKVTSNVSLISVGPFHMAFITLDGKAYTVGSEKGGVLGNGHDRWGSINIPFEIPNLPKVTLISCGFKHTFLVTENGDGYAFGDGSEGRLGDGDTSYHMITTPLQITTITEKIRFVSCGVAHTALITVDGYVYTFGRNEGGQLGNRQSIAFNNGIPLLIPDLPEVVFISCGYNHTGLITKNGDAYVFGQGRDGKLGDGIKPEHIVGKPMKVKDIPSKIVSISCARNHTGLVTIEGEAFMCGEGACGSLGDNITGFHQVTTWTAIPYLQDIKTISCGDTNTVLLTHAGDAYILGYHIDGYIGIPQKIMGLPLPIESISCGTGFIGLVSIAEKDTHLLPISCVQCGKEANYFTLTNSPLTYCSEQCHIKNFSE